MSNIQQPTDPNIVPNIMCPVRSGMDSLPLPGAINPNNLQIHMVPKHAFCMKNCQFFDKDNDQCYGLTLIQKALKLAGSFGA